MNRAYYGWLAGSTLSVFGDTALFFALGWAATGIGPRVAVLVLTGFTLPRSSKALASGCSPRISRRSSSAVRRDRI